MRLKWLHALSNRLLWYACFNNFLIAQCFILRRFYHPAERYIWMRNRNSELTYSTFQLKFSPLVNKMRSHFLFLVIDKSWTSFYHLVVRLMRPTDLQQVVPTNLISSARNESLKARCNLLWTESITLVGTTCSLLPSSTWEQDDNNLFQNYIDLARTISRTFLYIFQTHSRTS